MNYFFDESGNWSQPQKERNILLIGGLLIKNKTLQKELEQEIKIFKSKNRLSTIHANELSPYIKEELYQIIHKYLMLDDIKPLVYYFNPKVLFSQTIKDPDELYIDIASKLISDITFGDNKIEIEYDMKFHYAYPQNIIENFKGERRTEYVNMEKSFILSEEGYIKNKKRLISTLSNTLSKNRKLQEFYNLLCEPKSNQQIEFINNYLWTEFRLKIDKSNFLKDKFRDRINEYTKQKSKSYNIPYDDTRAKIKYKHKHYQSAGVQIIDLICNLVWKHGDNLPKNSSSAIKGIYKRIELKDISDEI